MLAGAQGFFGALAVFDIHIQSVPTDDPALGVAHRKSAGSETSDTLRRHAWHGPRYSMDSRSRWQASLGDGVRTIVRMHRFGPVLQLIHGHASVIEAPA